MNPEPTLTALGLPLEGKPSDDYDTVVQRVQDAIGVLESSALDTLMNDQYLQAGTIAYTADEYFATEHGKQSSKIGLYEIIKDEGSSQPPSWWPETSASSPKRPLAGLKVVDLTRVIAGPSITRSLAELGASVMRITSPDVTDISALHQDLNWGKWNAHLNLKQEADKEKLRALIRDADVVVDGYRPGVMERLGFGRQGIFDLIKGSGRERGIIHARENCYGWHGPFSKRSGWQQISDAVRISNMYSEVVSDYLLIRSQCCGVSSSFAHAMGLDEATTPIFPNSDYWYI